MPIDPGLQEELQRRGLASPSASGANGAKSPPGGGANGAKSPPGLWDELKKRGLTEKAQQPEEKTSAGEAAGQGLWEGLKSFYKGAEGLGVKMLTGISGQGSEMVPKQQAQMAQQRQAFEQSPAMKQHPI